MTGDPFRITPLPVRDVDAELLEAASAALDRMKAREGESIEVWARRLAGDLVKFTD